MITSVNNHGKTLSLDSVSMSKLAPTTTIDAQDSNCSEPVNTTKNGKNISESL